MGYTIICNGKAFKSTYYSYENCYVCGMIVIDELNKKITFNGIDWSNIEEDSL